MYITIIRTIGCCFDRSISCMDLLLGCSCICRCILLPSSIPPSLSLSLSLGHLCFWKLGNERVYEIANRNIRCERAEHDTSSIVYAKVCPKVIPDSFVHSNSCNCASPEPFKFFAKTMTRHNPSALGFLPPVVCLINSHSLSTKPRNCAIDTRLSVGNQVLERFARRS